MSEQKFFRCPHCGNMIGLIHGEGEAMLCCKESMQELTPNTTDGATEKHLPVIRVKERLIHAEVGSVAHPMTEEHHIDFIYLQTEQGGQMKRLCTDGKATAIFAVLEDTPVSVYAYCNLHGLWKSEVCAACARDGADGKKTETACCTEHMHD